MLFILLATTLLGTIGSPAQGMNHAQQCPVGVLVIGPDHRYALGISATLKTQGPLMVFIPKYEKCGFRVIRAPANEPASLPPDVIEVRSRKMKKPSLLYDFETPVKLRVWWTDVAPAESGGSEAFTVQPGRYRFSAVFSLSDPTKAEGDTVNLCRIYSDAFEVTHSSHFLQLP